MHPLAQVKSRFETLAKEGQALPPSASDCNLVDSSQWSKWSTSALHLIEIVFGKTSVAYINFTAISSNFSWYRMDAERACFVLLAAKDDFESGFALNLEQRISGEIFGDFVVFAKEALSQGHKDVAAVLACAALEDTLKRYATLNGIDVMGKTMDNVVGLLKTKGLVQGAQKSLLDVMPRIRNQAMHADWAKISDADVGSVIGFVETFLQTKFS